MNFDNAISAHAGWKLKLSKYIAKPDGSLKCSEVSSDRNCELGKWIHVSGNQYAGMPEYSTLKQEHARFHKAAGNIIGKADQGERVTDEIALGANSEYALASGAVVRALMAMKSKLGQ